MQIQLRFHARILQGQRNNRVQHHPEDMRAKNPIVTTKNLWPFMGNSKNQHEIHGHEHFQRSAVLLGEWLK